MLLLLLSQSHSRVRSPRGYRSRLRLCLQDPLLLHLHRQHARLLRHVGRHGVHPGLCVRCVDAVESGLVCKAAG